MEAPAELAAPAPHLDGEYTDIIITPETSELDSGQLGTAANPGATAASDRPAASTTARQPATSPPAALPAAALPMALSNPAVLGLLSNMGSISVMNMTNQFLETMAAKTGRDKLTMVSWKEMFDTDRIKIIGPYTSRVPQNFRKYLVNYLIIALLLTLGFMLFSVLFILLTTSATASLLWVILVTTIVISAHALLFQSDEERPDHFFLPA
jgi:hypothetical protein